MRTDNVIDFRRNFLIHVLLTLFDTAYSISLETFYRATTDFLEELADRGLPCLGLCSDLEVDMAAVADEALDQAVENGLVELVGTRVVVIVSWRNKKLMYRLLQTALEHEGILSPSEFNTAKEAASRVHMKYDGWTRATLPIRTA